LGIQYSKTTQLIIEGISQSERLDPSEYEKRMKESEAWTPNSMVQYVFSSNPMLPKNSLQALQLRWGFHARMKMASIVCALERYRLDFGQYPQMLGELVPNYLTKVPQDIILDGNFQYFLTEKGEFRLYSIGWNAQDDHGTPSQRITQNGITRYNYDEGDWVWPYPGMNSVNIDQR
jgi:hypothetical protein